MGHREDLLEGAKRCLMEKGFARTTARDIVAASGANLASIGYHYGSKEALLTEAYLEAIREWGEDFTAQARPAADGSGEQAADPAAHFEEVWTRLIELFPAHRHLWAASLEMVSVGDRMPKLRDAIAKAQPEGWSGLVALFHGVDEEKLDERTARTLGKFYSALLNGVMALWLFDPESAPTGRELGEALRTIVRGDLTPPLDD